MRSAAPDFQRTPNNIACLHDSPSIDYAHDHVDGVLFEALQFPKMRYWDQSAIDVERVESLAFRPARHVCMKAFARFHERRENLQRRAFCSRLDLFHDRRDALFCDRQIAVWTKLCSGLCKQEPKEMVNFGYRRYSRFASTARDSLLNRHTRRQPADQIDIGLFELLDELPRIWRHAVEKAALTFGKQDIERESRFAGTTQTGDHYKLLPRNFNVDVFEIVLQRAVNLDGAVCSGERGRLDRPVRRRAERFFCRA